MKWSKYNFLFKSEKHGYLLYNSFTNGFAELDEKTFILLKKMRDDDIFFNEIINDTEKKELIEPLKSSEIVVNDDFDAISYLKVKYMYTKMNKDRLSLTLIPTLDCNFRCFYCFESRNMSKYMDLDTEKSLIEFIKSKNAKDIDITWYGGEPLLAFSTIERITKEVKKLKVNFNSGMVTNGYLLSEKIIEKLDDLKISFLQITIDGLKDLHNKRRPHKTEKDSFEKIIYNIKRLLRSDWNGHLSIRVNVDKNNLEIFNQVRCFFKENFNYNNIKIYPGYIKNIPETNAEKLSNCIENNEIIGFETHEYMQNKNLELDFYPYLNQTGICSANMINSFLIGPEGEIYKCWNDVGNEKMIVGNIKEENSGNKNLLMKYLAIDPFDDDECRECFYLPICMGGCPYNRLMNKYYGKNIDNCSKFKGNIKKYLEAHYEKKLMENNNNESTVNEKY